MKLIKTKLTVIMGLSLSISISSANAESLLIAATAGYRKPLLQLMDDFTNKTDIKAESSFGHLKQVETQARQNPDIALLIADEQFLAPLGLADKFVKLGDGKLALIYAKDKKISNLDDLKKEKIERIATPDQKRAMYGKAAIQCLSNIGLLKSIKSKIIESDTVPQVGSYVALGEVDAGFVNLTEALGQGDKIGGYIQTPSDCYEPIKISVAVTKGHENDSAVNAWLDYIHTDSARNILAQFGLD